MSNFPRTVFGYEIDVHRNENDFEIKVPAFPKISSRSNSLGRAIRDLWPRVQAEIDAIEVSGKSPPKTLFEGKYHDAVSKRLVDVNRFISQYGFCAIGDLTTPELATLEGIVKGLRGSHPSPPSDPAARMVIENMIFSGIKNIVIGPHLRAANVAGLWMKVPALKKFSHIVESSNLLYYRSDYIPLVLTLVPIIEGTLLSWYGYDYARDKMPNESKLLNFMVEQFPTKPKGNHPLIWEEYVRSFVYIYENIFYGTHQKAHDDLFFNRHYVAHGMGEGWFYHRNNVCKLTLLLDLLAHIVADSTGCHDRFNVSDAEMKPHEECYNKMLNFYLQASFGEEDLLKRHSFYKGKV